jgi:hypothetical protein
MTKEQRPTASISQVPAQADSDIVPGKSLQGMIGIHGRNVVLNITKSP